MTFGLLPPNLLEGHFPSDARSPSRCRSRTVPSTKAHSRVVPFSAGGHRQYAWDEDVCGTVSLSWRALSACWMERGLCAWGWVSLKFFHVDFFPPKMKFRSWLKIEARMILSEPWSFWRKIKSYYSVLLSNIPCFHFKANLSVFLNSYATSHWFKKSWMQYILNVSSFFSLIMLKKKSPKGNINENIFWFMLLPAWFLFI